MSYDVRIMKADGPDDEPRASLSVRAVVGAIDLYPPFVERGITWANQRWYDYGPWEGMVIDLEDCQPDCNPEDARGDIEGECEACNMNISYGTDSDLRACLSLAVHIARASGARAWDLQLDQELTIGLLDKALMAWEDVRYRFRDILRLGKDKPGRRGRRG